MSFKCHLDYLCAVFTSFTFKSDPYKSNAPCLQALQTSPGIMSGSPHNMATGSADHKSPKFGKNDNFIPLGFSSPINTRERDESAALYPSQQRNFDPYFSGNRRPNFRNNYRNRFQPHNRKTHEQRGTAQQNQQQQHSQQNYFQNRNQNWRQFQDGQTPGSGRKGNNQLDNFFHPSMLEDPWRNLVTQYEMKKAAETQEINSGRARSSSETSNEAKGSPASSQGDD